MKDKGWIGVVVQVVIIGLVVLSFIGGPAKGDENVEMHTQLVKIEDRDNLYYDPQTKVVYILFNEAYGNRGYGYLSAYYAENGKPYKFDLSLRELVEIP